MTLLSGGRAEFKWEDVKNDSQRENYLGHSLMAPVGRWQQGRDLGWYAKGDSDSKDAEAARIADEKRAIKQAEEDAMLVAMGLPVPVRDNANLTPLGNKAHEADVKDSLEAKAKQGDERNDVQKSSRRERSRKHGENEGERRRHRSRSRSRHRERRHRHREHSTSRDKPRHSDRRDRHRHRSHSREHRRREERPERLERPRGQDLERKPSVSPARERRRRRDTRSRSPYAKDRRRT